MHLPTWKSKFLIHLQVSSLFLPHSSFRQSVLFAVVFICSLSNHSERSDILKDASDQHNWAQVPLCLYLHQTPPSHTYLFFLWLWFTIWHFGHDIAVIYLFIYFFYAYKFVYYMSRHGNLQPVVQHWDCHPPLCTIYLSIYPNKPTNIYQIKPLMH